MGKNISAFILTLFLLVSTVSFVSAKQCYDSDGGINTSTAGAVVIYDWITKAYPDVCKGAETYRYDSDGKRSKVYPNISESYCGTDNNKESQMKSVAELGAGYCLAESITVDGRTFNAGKWISSVPACYDNGEGTVINQNGEKFNSGCSGDTYIQYNCSGSNVNLVSSQNCSLLGADGKCTSNGCIGNCSQTDSNNSRDIAGIVYANGQTYLDQCNSAGTAVKQYKCANGKAKVIMVSEGNPYSSCGANRECVADSVTGAGYCRNKYAGAATIATLSEQIAALQAQIASLIDRIEALEGSA